MADRTMTRREMVGTLGGLALAATLGPSRAFAADERPNILYIMTDDHAAHALSCYGSRLNQTPHLDRIAREGMLLENCFVTNSLCGPSRATLLTGKYSHKHGFYRNGNRFDGSQQTFPKLLQKAGYQTAVVGKWHLATDPTGFDYSNILPGQGAYHNPVMIEMGERKKLQGYTTDLITDLSIAFLRKRDKTKPFCLLCHHKAPHRNWQPDAKHAEMFKDKAFPEPETFNDDWATRSRAAREQTMTVEHHLTRGDVKVPWPNDLTGQALKKWKYQRYMQDYLACIQSVDDNVGRLLAFLDAEGLAENTLVIYTTDNGFFLGDHGWFDKRFMFEHSLRVPLVVRHPRAIQPGTRSDRFVLNTDFAPTFLELAGVPVPGDIQGRSILPVLQGKPPADWRTSVYYHYYEFPGAHSVRRHYGVRTERYKLIHYYRIDEWELFDLQKDPNELKNVYADPAYAEAVRETKAELDRLRKELEVPEDTDAAGRPAGPPAVGVQLLLALGDGAGGASIRDTSGKGRHLAAHGTRVVDGRKGKAREFDGKGDYLDLPGSRCPNPANTPVTVEAWVRPSQPDGVVLAHGGESWGYALHLEKGRLAFTTCVSDRRTRVAARETIPSEWTHVAGRLAKDGTMTLFVNGQPAGRAKAPGLLAQQPHDNLQVGTDAGSPVVETQGRRFFGGAIGEVRVIYGDRTDREIAEDAKP